MDIAVAQASCPVGRLCYELPPGDCFRTSDVITLGFRNSRAGIRYGNLGFSAFRSPNAFRGRSVSASSRHRISAADDVAVFAVCRSSRITITPSRMCAQIRNRRAPARAKVRALRRHHRFQDRARRTLDCSVQRASPCRREFHRDRDIRRPALRRGRDQGARLARVPFRNLSAPARRGTALPRSDSRTRNVPGSARDRSEAFGPLFRLNELQDVFLPGSEHVNMINA